MKKWEKYYISITGVIFIITCIISIIFLRNVSHLSEVTVVIIKMILCLILLLIEVAMVVYFSILGIITMKRGMDKIRDLENELIITDQDEQILETKQVVINKLIEIRQKKKLKKQKEKLETDIKQVGQLNLCMGDYTTYYIQKINIKGVSGCLVYDLEKGKENNYMGELNLINEDYSILYQILNRYDLISYYEREK